MQRFIDEKHGGKGRSAIVGHGTANSVFAASALEFPKDIAGKLSFVKVGDKGKVIRSYTNCCGTQCSNCIFPRMCVMIRTGIYEADGTTPFAPEVFNGNAKYAFDPSIVPEPKMDTVPYSFMFSFVKAIVNPFAAKFQQTELFPDVSTVEAVPITWEE
jgi:hypothetical protein